jgi:hypothetical protein
VNDKANETLQTTDGSVRLTPREITAHGKERRSLSATRFAGSALILLLVIFGGSLAFGRDSHELATLVGTVFGLFVGRFGQRGD